MGTYGPFAMADGVSVIGGFSATFGSARSKAATTVQGGLAPSADHWTAVDAVGLTAPTVLGYVTLLGPSPSTAGTAAYTLYARSDATGSLTVRNSKIVGGTGTAGSAGSAGADAASLAATPAMAGGSGGNGDEFTTNCDSTSRGAAGPAGTNAATGSPSTSAMGGGAGGAGGTMDTRLLGLQPELHRDGGSTRVRRCLRLRHARAGRVGRQRQRVMWTDDRRRAGRRPRRRGRPGRLRHAHQRWLLGR